MANSLPVGSGFSSNPGSPDYFPLNAKETTQEIVNTKNPQGSNPRGVILTPDNEGIPLEIIMGKIGNDPYSSARPMLKESLFQMINVSPKAQAEEMRGTFELLLSFLPTDLQEKLTQDKQLPFEDRDPDLVALDLMLKFETGFAAAAARVSMPEVEGGTALTEAKRYEALPGEVNGALMALTDKILSRLEDYLTVSSPNDIGHDLLLNALNALQQGKETIRSH